MKILIAPLALLLLAEGVHAAKLSTSHIKTVITAVAAGASAVGFGESGEKEALRDAHRKQGVDPEISATFDLEIWLDSNADAVYWADTFGSADLFLVLEGGGVTAIAPFKHGGFKGGTIRHQLQGNIIPPNQGFTLHLYDDDNLWGDVFTALQPKRVSASAGLLTPVGVTKSEVTLELQGGRTEIKDPDYIGAIAFTTPDDKQWTVRGDIQDQYGRTIGKFSVSQHPMSSLGVFHSGIGLFVGVAGAVIAVFVGLPLIISKVRLANDPQRLT